MKKDKIERPILLDERQERIRNRIATFFLFFTQLGLAGIIMFRRYGLHQTNEQIADLNILLAVSIFGYFAIQLIFNAGLPMLSFRKTLVIYSGFVILLSTVLIFWYGFPALSEWKITILPVLVGPAILLGAYHLFAGIGRKRMENELKE